MTLCEKCGVDDEKNEDANVKWFNDKWMCEGCIRKWRNQQKVERSPSRGGLGTGDLGR